jgi:hypothetical protein
LAARGDRNTKIFHAKASSRRRRNYLQGLFDENGVWKDVEEDMEGIVGRYFSSLFESSQLDSSHLGPMMCVVQSRLPPNLKDSLDVPFTADEVKDVLFKMNLSKASREDGFPVEFFQKNWSVVGNDVTKLMFECLNEGQSVRLINRSLLCLIPKVKKVVRMMELRPISLCNVIYKCISKALANRLRLGSGFGDC